MNQRRNLKQNAFAPLELKNKWTVVFGTPSGDWMNHFPENGIPFTANGVFDLDTIHPGKEMDECVVYQEFESETDGKFLIGVSVDWWYELYLNGKLCVSTMAKGNNGSAFDPERNSEIVPAQKGKNLLAIRVRRGSCTWSFACSGVRTMPQQTIVTLGPWVTNPDAGRISIRFLTSPDTGAGVKYRKKGESGWKTKWPVADGLVLRSDNHLIDLEGLCPGADYEYAVIMRDLRSPSTIIEDEIFTFHVPDSQKDTVSFLFTADLQYSPALQTKYIQAMFTAADYASCDFFVAGGDICEYNDIRQELLYAAVQDMIDFSDMKRPIVYSRGNHELRGAQASLFKEFFALPNGRTYGIFRYGSTAFLVLDCWEDKPAESGADHVIYHDDRPFLQAETEYLDRILQTPAWTSAKRRIVLAHGAVYSNYDACRWQPFRLQKMTDKWFHGKNPVSKLDLWLCGHSHVYLRSYPGTNEVAAPAEPPAPFRNGEDDIYPVLTVGGPGSKYPVQASTFRVDVAADGITVKSFDQDGKLFDHVQFLDDGTVRELIPIPHFRLPLNTEGDLYFSADDPL